MAIIFLVIIFLLIPPPIQSQEKAKQEDREVFLFPALGINILSNVGLNLGGRYIAREGYAQISFESIQNNFLSPWEWDGSAYFTNQFGHPYQGSVYHAAARANGFTFYESILFDIFGSAAWELVFETNTPATNDLISTTIGGASLGEMLHRLYLETPSPALAMMISPVDAFNGLVTGRRSVRKRAAIHSMDLSLGTGHVYSRQAAGKFRNHELIPLRETFSVSADGSFTLVYGNPFIQQSWTPYNHFELALYAHIAYPFWYNFNIRSDGYLFSFNVIDNEKSSASTGLSLHYDLFADRHSNFFGESLDWTFKYKRMVNTARDFIFKGHIGAVIFNADDSYVFDKNVSILNTNNNYGAGVTMKLFVSSVHKKWGTATFNAALYGVSSVFDNKHTDNPDILFLYTDLSYEFPFGDDVHIGAANSTFRNATISNRLKDTDKLSSITRFFIRIGI
jgi:hypothetical protein